MYLISHLPLPPPIPSFCVCIPLSPRDWHCSTSVCHACCRNERRRQPGNTAWQINYISSLKIGPFVRRTNRLVWAITKRQYCGAHSRYNLITVKIIFKNYFSGLFVNSAHTMPPMPCQCSRCSRFPLAAQQEHNPPFPLVSEFGFAVVWRGPVACRSGRTSWLNFQTLKVTHCNSKPTSRGHLGWNNKV